MAAISVFAEGVIVLPKDPLSKVIFRGKLVDAWVMCLLLKAEAELGYRLSIMQGCFSKGSVSASAGTHDLGGVCDLAAYDWVNKVTVLGDLGGYPYHRLYTPGVWPEHIHCGVRNHGNRADLLVAQQRDWDSRPPKNGLVGHANLTGQYHPMKFIECHYVPGEKFQVPEQTKVEQARDSLVEAIHKVAETAAFLDQADGRPAAQAQIDNLKVQHKDLRNILKTLPKK